LADGRLQMSNSQYEALKNADGLALLTEWKRFRQPDFAAMKAAMNEPVIFDGRNQYDPVYLTEVGFKYRGIGRRNF
jgi:UDPglucose 6-dehydrogenase